MKHLTPALCALLCLTPEVVRATDPPLPRLESRGQARQLVVDGRPYLILGGEVANTASSSLDYMRTVWPRLARLKLNTVLVAVAWAWVEPEEGRFDFALVDGLLAGARQHDLRVIFLWFGSWKNGVSSFAPGWVKADPGRFPRVRLKGGRSVEILSPLSEATRAADTRAYVRFMEHLAKVDAQRRTVLMIQLQNEVGVLGDSRDRGDAANAAFAGSVPGPLTEFLVKNEQRLTPGLAKLWTAAGARAAGSWEQVFGSGPAAEELFMAWHYARYMEHMAAAGKAAYPLPVFTNSWIVQPEDTGPGDYPSGGPLPLTLDIWKAGARSIDFNAPDIYQPNFDEWVTWFRRPDNPLFVPESRGDATGVANAFYAIGQHASLGYSPFGIDSSARLVTPRPDPGQSAPAELESLPLARGYAVLRDLAPLILEHQARGTIAAAWLNQDKPRTEIALGDHTLSVELRRNRRNPSQVPPLGYGMFLQMGSDEYLAAGTDIQVTFSPRTPGPPIAGIADAEAGVVTDGRWVAGRKMSGDDILLSYELAKAAEQNQSGSGLRFGPDGPTLQRVRLYRYR
jgi:hypothetical protein